MQKSTQKAKKKKKKKNTQKVKKKKKPFLKMSEYLPIFISYPAKEPAVRELKFAQDPGSQKIWSHWYKLQIPGTQMFMTMSGGQVRTEVCKCDDAKKYSKSIN